MNSVANSIAPSLKYCAEREVAEHLEEGQVVRRRARPRRCPGVRKHFCEVVVSGAGGGSRPRKNGICGCMPAIVSSVEWSSGGGISGPTAAAGGPSPRRRRGSPRAARPSSARRDVGAAAWLSLRAAALRAVGLVAASPARSRRGSSRASARIRRETCICEMPTCCAICDCVSPSKKRRCRMRRSRSSSSAEARREHRAVLRDLVLVLLGAERLERVELAVLVGAAAGQRERACRRGPDSSASSTSSSSTPAAFASSAIVGERPSWTVSSLDELRQLDVQLLEAARHAHRPAAVAEVALDLADDVRRRVGRELDAAVDVEAVDRLDQADRSRSGRDPRAARRGRRSAGRASGRGTCTARSAARGRRGRPRSW